MKEELTDELKSIVSKICHDYQSERVSGQYYIEQTGLNKISKALGGTYSNLTKKQRKELRGHCVDTAMGYYSVRTWWYYLNV